MYTTEQHVLCTLLNIMFYTLQHVQHVLSTLLNSMFYTLQHVLCTLLNSMFYTLQHVLCTLLNSMFDTLLHVLCTLLNSMFYTLLHVQNVMYTTEQHVVYITACTACFMYTTEQHVVYTTLQHFHESLLENNNLGLLIPRLPSSLCLFESNTAVVNHPRHAMETFFTTLESSSWTTAIDSNIRCIKPYAGPPSITQISDKHS